jgi:hypothetical protein
MKTMRRIVFLWLVLVGLVLVARGVQIITQAQTQSPVSPGPITYNTTANSLQPGSQVLFTEVTTAAFLQIDGPSGEMLVKVSLKDGKFEFGKNYTPDAAGKAFWEAIGSKYPCPRTEENKK